MNNEEITIQDCIDNYEKKGKVAIINDGCVIGFGRKVQERRW